MKKATRLCRVSKALGASFGKLAGQGKLRKIRASADPVLQAFNIKYTHPVFPTYIKHYDHHSTQ